jgi:hypothetical protein
MKRVCPGCRKIVDLDAPSCKNCQMTFFETPEPPQDFADVCIRIAGLVLVIAIGAFVTVVLHPWS